jgi:hypothetical protein
MYHKLYDKSTWEAQEPGNVPCHFIRRKKFSWQRAQPSVKGEGFGVVLRMSVVHRFSVWWMVPYNQCCLKTIILQWNGDTWFWEQYCSWLVGNGAEHTADGCHSSTSVAYELFSRCIHVGRNISWRCRVERGRKRQDALRVHMNLNSWIFKHYSNERISFSFFGFQRNSHGAWGEIFTDYIITLVVLLFSTWHC